MRRADFSYQLPQELIAQQPPPQRRDARLLTLGRSNGAVDDRAFTDLPGLLQAGDLLVFNRSRVIPARLYGRKSSGGRVEILIERIVSDDTALVHLRASKTPHPGAMLALDGTAEVELLAREDDLWRVRFDRPVAACIDQHGHVPLPPYIDRADTASDYERYQTVYADRPGAIAAPTAGLHFDEQMLTQLQEMAVDTAFVTLHVAAGTFQPVRSDDLSQHRMHAERIIVDEDVCSAVAAARQRGGRVIAVGTTSVRTLESAALDDGTVASCDTDTRLFITPGFRFRVVDAMLTNFHLPESTLLMLVSAFAGHRNVMQAYQHAVTERYRFFSYGDAMFISDGADHAA
ncbi:MAG: tRNA preQ1(34) S-adenosylmethionine ribosyltransferase-isomerase QueA [Gammaproteobacteria bacterium]|nr:tRNA preQ1(34) S-adenosylmethionine ribosyltransferase-isomerase QueA [Gammaproteobacteria bacterium]NNM20554.1 tRNA preQ1(34) S-adenosylmethionine ribosyltransferase-isomerase QueA [Gammaproteobacteria bacterium]